MIKPGDVVVHTRLRTAIRVENVWPDGQVYGVDPDGGERRWRARDCEKLDDTRTRTNGSGRHAAVKVPAYHG